MTEELDPELAALLEGPTPTTNGKASTPTAPVEKQRRKPHHRRRGGGDGSRAAVIGNPNEPKVEAPETPAEPSPSPASVAAAQENSKSAFVVWPRVLEDCAVKSIPPDQIGIRIERFATGPQKSKSEDMAPFSGDLVSGFEGGSPADALYEFVRDYYHMGTLGPATYRMTFFLRYGGKGTIPGVMELSYSSPEAIERQKVAVANAKLRSAAMGSMPGLAGLPSTPWPSRGSAPTSPASPTASPQEIELLKRLADMSGQNGYLRALAEMAERGQAAPAAVAPVAPAPVPVRDPRLPPPGVSEEEWEEVLSRRQARTVGPAVVQALQAVGLTPELLGRLATAAAAPPPAPVQVQPPDPFSAFRSFIDTLGAYKKAELEMRGLFPGGAGAEEDGTPAAAAEDPSAMKVVAGGLVKFPGTDVPMSWGQKLEDESWPEFFMRWGTHNPAALQAVMGQAAKVVDPQALGKLMTAVAEKMSAKSAPPPTPTAPTAPAAAPAPALGWAPRE